MLLRMEERNISHRIFFSNWDLKKLRFPAAADVYDEQKSLSSLRLSLNKLPKGGV
jgi:hypothetical protein